jgi:hypothetical protein
MSCLKPKPAVRNMLVKSPFFVSTIATVRNPNLEYRRIPSAKDITIMSRAYPSTLSQSIFKSVEPTPGSLIIWIHSHERYPREDRSTKPEKFGLLAYILLPCRFWKLSVSLFRDFLRCQAMSIHPKRGESS